MEAVIFTGIQAAGKSTYFKHAFFKTHIRINLDMLKTRHREQVLLTACFEMKQAFVVDNTNPSKEDRKRYIQPAREHHFKVLGYYFNSEISEALKRNCHRPKKEFIPEKGIKGTYKKLHPPEYSEGFDELFQVQINQTNGFDVKRWENK